MPQVPPPARPGSFVVVTNPGFSAKIPNVVPFYTQEEIDYTLHLGPDFSKL
jgi:hypothetical protein